MWWTILRACVALTNGFVASWKIPKEKGYGLCEKDKNWMKEPAFAKWIKSNEIAIVRKRKRKKSQSKRAEKKFHLPLPAFSVHAKRIHTFSPVNEIHQMNAIVPFHR